MSKLTLITNVDFVEVNGVRCDAHAVLIEPPYEATPSFGPPRVRVRGFGVDGAQPVFTVRLDTDDPAFEIVDAQDPSKIIIGDSGDARPLFSGGLLRIGGITMFLQAHDHEQEISVDEFSQDEITSVWEVLPGRIAKFWRAPNMPTLRWVPAVEVRQAYAARV